MVRLKGNLDHDIIEGRGRLVERLLPYTNEFPWTSTPTLVKEFFSDAGSIKVRRRSTTRGTRTGVARPTW